LSPLGVTLLVLVGITGFVVLAWRKLALLGALAPEPRFDAPRARVKSVLVNGLLQRRMLERDWKPGLMHAVIFGGFLVLLLRKVQLLAIGWHEPFVYPGLAGGLFAALKDAVELAVLAAVGYALWRRLVLHPRRLERNREALVVLALIATIMLTDLLFDGLRFALFAAAGEGIAHERAFAFAGRWVSTWFDGVERAALVLPYRLVYGVQLATVFAFLVILPLGEHFHIVTALPALYFRRGTPARAVPAVDLDAILADDADPATLRVGARSARELSWKDGLDAFTCTECGRCKDACPTFLTGKPLAQKWVHDVIKRHLIEQRAALRRPDAELPPLVGPVISEDALWACTTCGYCEAACPIELEHLPKFFALRQQRVLMEGAFPHELKAVFEAWESQGNPWGLPAQNRADWAQGMEPLQPPVPRWTQRAQAADFDVLFYVGSAASYDPRGQKIARAFVQVLRAAGVRFAILGAGEGSTGECARRCGNEMLFQQLARALAERLDALGVRHIVTTDPHAFNALKHELCAYGGPWRVEHHSQFIARALAERRLAPAARFSRVVFHDPCYLGRHNEEYDAPRRALAAVIDDRLLECALHGAKAMCCGAGGGRMWMEESIGSRINELRTAQALETAPRVIATACPYCALMIDDGLKALGDKAAGVVNRDIAELVAEALHRADPV
jgi:Fe-S oxidoreductase